jgi:hypothetical protein
MSDFETEGFLSDEGVEGRKIFRKRFEAAFSLADELNRVALVKIREVKLGSADQAPFIIFLLTIRIIELFESIIILMERGILSSAKLLIRPLLEALFTLVAIDKDKSLVSKYFDTQDEAHLKLLKSSTQWKNEILKKAFKDSGLEAKYIQQKNKLSLSPPDSMKPIEWAKAAGLDDLYHSFYVQYSSYTHSNLSALRDHIDSRDDNVLEASFGPSIEDLYDHIRNAVSFTLIALAHMCLTFDLEIDSEIRNIHKIITDLDDNQKE